MRDHLLPALRRLRHHEWLAVGVVALPLALNGVRAAIGGWVPIGDDAYFAVRSRDVATVHHPLVGAWSSGSADLEYPVNNLGPLQLDLLAPFTKLAPMGGTAVGVMLLNVVWLALIAWLVARVAGRRAVLPAMVAVGLLTWTMGSEMLITPRQHQFLVLPYLCLLVATWAGAAGDRWAVVVFVGLGSLATQTHLSYPILVVALAGMLLVGQVVAARRGESTGDRLPWLVASGIGIAAWSQPIVDQFAGRGNLWAAFTSPGSTPGVGVGRAVRIVADVLVSPAAFSRPGFRTLTFDTDLAGAPQVACLIVGVAFAVGAFVHLLRMGEWRWASGVAVALTSVVAAVVNAAVLPPSIFGVLAMNYRWLWSTGSFILLLVLIAVTQRLGRSERWRRVVVGVSWTLVVAAAAANTPPSIQAQAAAVYRADRARVATMIDQLRSAELSGPAVVDDDAMYFGHPFTYPLLLALQDRGIEFRFDDERMIARFGDGRRADGTETVRLVLVGDGDAVAVRGDPDVIVDVDAERDFAVLLVRS